MPFGSFLIAGLHVLTDGSVLVVGTRFAEASRDGQLTVLRVSPSGRLDDAFGTGGIVMPFPGPGHSWANASLVHGDRLYIGGGTTLVDETRMLERRLVLALALDDLGTVAVGRAELTGTQEAFFISSLALSPVHGILAGVWFGPYSEDSGTERAGVVAFSPSLARAELIAALDVSALPLPNGRPAAMHYSVRVAVDGAWFFVTTDVWERDPTRGEGTPQRSRLAIGDSATLVSQPDGPARLPLRLVLPERCEGNTKGVVVTGGHLLIGATLTPARWQSVVVVSRISDAPLVFDTAIAGQPGAEVSLTGALVSGVGGPALYLSRAPVGLIRRPGPPPATSLPQSPPIAMILTSP